MEQAGSVELRHVSLTLNGLRTILDDVSLRLAPGSTTALLGRSGSGKTTLLRTVNALIRPTSGNVLVDGIDLFTLDEDKLRTLRRRIGYVIQETGLFPHMTIGRNVALPMELAGEPKSHRDERAAEMLEMVGLPAGSFLSRYPHQLSGGQRQRAGLARALILQPTLLLLDEPFGALDPLTRSEMQALLKGLLARFKTTAILVTHDLQEAMYLAEQIVFIDGGKILASIGSNEIESSVHPAVTAYRNAAKGLHGVQA